MFCISLQLDSMPKTEAMSHDMKNFLEPYLFEAGLGPSDLSNKRDLVINGLALHQVIEKWRLELDDLAKGKLNECLAMNSVTLYNSFSTFLCYIATSELYV